MEPKRKIKSIEGFSNKRNGRLGSIGETGYHPTRQRRYIMEIPIGDVVREFHVGTEIPRLQVTTPTYGEYMPIFGREWEPILVKFLDLIGGGNQMGAIESLNSWFGDVSSDQHARTYKKNITLKALDPTGMVVEQWSIMGAFPTTVSINTDYNSHEPIYDIQMTLSFDHCNLNL